MLLLTVITGTESHMSLESASVPSTGTVGSYGSELAVCPSCVHSIYYSFQAARPSSVAYHTRDGCVRGPPGIRYTLQLWNAE